MSKVLPINDLPILVIVESPNKIPKLKSILGSSKYIFEASVGHIIDIILNPQNKLLIFDDKFDLEYKTNSDKIDVVKRLKLAFKKSSSVLIATDKDREGEMIAWAIAKILKLGHEEIHRIVFTEITKKAIMNAISTPTEINMNIVNAQKARRVLDRILGFELSPILCRTIQGDLGIGRVQAIVVKLLVEQEEKILDFFNTNNSSFFKFVATFASSNNTKIKATLYSIKTSKKKKDINDELVDNNSSNIAKISTYDQSFELMDLMIKSKYEVNGVVEKESTRNPSAPFTTSTLSQESNQKLRLSVKATMNAAQHLYEAGYITYMRTDSVNLSDEALLNIKNYVVNKYGKEYHKQTFYEAKIKNTQEAHEAIRPTDCFIEEVPMGGKISINEIKLYSLIWKRAVASQISPAKIMTITVQIKIDLINDYMYAYSIDKVIFNGFLVVYNIPNIDENEEQGNDQLEQANENKFIAKIGEKMNPINIISTQDYEKPTTRYNEASLIKRLDPKDLNIGRPSTYATIIGRIQEHGYVIEQDILGIEKDINIITWKGPNTNITTDAKKIIIGKESNKLVPTEIGKIVTKFLNEHFPDIMDYKFTAKMENGLDKISQGTEIWTDVLNEFYKKFHPLILKLKSTQPLIQTNENSEEKVLGKHPEHNVDIIVTKIKALSYVKMLIHGSEKPQYAQIKEPLNANTITLDIAVKLLQYPKKLGQYEDNVIQLHKYTDKNKDTYFLKVNDTNYYLNYDQIPYPDDFNLENAIKAIIDKKKSILWSESDNKKIYTIINGEYGKYVIVKSKTSTAKPKTFKINKTEDIENMTIKRIKELEDLFKSAEEIKKSDADRVNKKDKKKDKKKDSTNDDGIKDKKTSKKKTTLSSANVKKTSSKSSHSNNLFELIDDEQETKGIKPKKIKVIVKNDSKKTNINKKN
jgi:DNA topoisomerase-1